MIERRFLACLAVAAVGLGMGSPFLRGAEGEALLFRLVPRVVEIPERGPVIGYWLYDRTNRYFFVPPHKWNVRPDPAQRMLTLTPPDLKSGIALRLMDPVATNETRSVTNFWADRLHERYPGATVTSEFKAFARNARGAGFDTQRIVQGRLHIFSRVVFVPTAASLIEFNLTTPSSLATNAVRHLSLLLNSFTIESGTNWNSATPRPAAPGVVPLPADAIQFGEDPPETEEEPGQNPLRSST